MKKKGYKPVWTECDTKAVEEYEKKLRTGKEVYIGFDDSESFHEYLESNLQVKEVKTDEYGNKIVVFRNDDLKKTKGIDGQ